MKKKLKNWKEIKQIYTRVGLFQQYNDWKNEEDLSNLTLKVEIALNTNEVEDIWLEKFPGVWHEFYHPVTSDKRYLPEEMFDCLKTKLDKILN